MRKFFIILLLTIAAAYGGIKLYFWYQITDAADAIVQRLRPVADVSYGGTIATLGGKVGIQDVEIRPVGYNTTTTIGAITFEADSLWELYNVSSEIQDGRIPPQLQVNMANMVVDPGSPLWQKYVGSPGLLAATENRFETLNCGNRTRFSGSDYDGMDIREISLNMHAGWKFHPAEQTISFYIRATVPELEKVALRLDYSATPSALTARSLLRSQGLSTLAGGQFKVSDLGWNAKVRKFCAAEVGKTEAEYVAGRVAAAWRELGELGVDAGAALKKSYRDYLMSDGGNINLSLDPTNPVHLKTLRFYKPTDILRLLNPTLLVNGQSVSLGGIKADEVFSTSEHRQSSASRRQAETRDDEYNYSDFPLYQLDRHLHQMVRLETAARIFEGKLTSIEDRYVTLEVRTYSGTHEVIVALRDINSAAAAKLVEQTSKSERSHAKAI